VFSSSNSAPTSHRGGPGSIPGLVKWDLWWTKWRRGRYNRPVSGRRAEWIQFGLHPPLCELKKKKVLRGQKIFAVLLTQIFLTISVKAASIAVRRTFMLFYCK
jgi:hypothetical protein